MDSREAFIEKLNAAHSFPTRYTFKLIGANRERFREDALEVLAEELPSADPEVSSRMSSGGNHVSVTVVATVADADTVARVYERFHGLEGLAMLL
ncbi:MAG TPA: DUF493 domain-containing protein [Myxococcales bacterium LLY-WYZ-16_1]|nr:DUF493 domain-containing protein [Myxococcales bacterium LLY-WYZ-16_1]